jgi:peptide/nickel transport system substrate-binding protein
MGQEAGSMPGIELVGTKGKSAMSAVTLSRRQLLQLASALGVTSSGAMLPWMMRASAAQGTPATEPMGSVTWAIDSDPVSLVPYGSSSTSNMHGKEFIYDSLLEWDRDLNIQPALAESYEAAPDATSYLFHLRQGVTFHDGRPLRAADVKYSLDMTLNPPAPVVASPYLANIAEVVVVDDATVRIDMSQPDPTIPGILAWQRMSPIFPEGIADEINLLSEGIGTGPFKLIEYVSNDHLEYEAFADYWKPGVPCIQHLTIPIIGEEQSRVALLRSGEIDGGNFSSDVVTSLEGDENFEVLSGLTSAPRTIYVNMAKDVPWRDIRVRQAVSKTIDRQIIIDNVYAGNSELTGPIPPGYGDWPLSQDELAEHYTVDVEGAKALMAEAGLEDGFSVTLIAISAPREYTQIAEIIAEQLKQINIDVSVEPQEIGTFVESINSEFEWASTGGGMRGDPSGYFSVFRSADEGTFAITYGDGWKSDELDQLYDQALATTDQAERHDLYIQLQKLVLEENPYLYTVQPYKFQVVNKRVTGMYVAYTDFNTGLRQVCVTDAEA